MTEVYGQITELIAHSIDYVRFEMNQKKRWLWIGRFQTTWAVHLELQKKRLLLIW